MTYVNLQLNPERYTGYTGPSARRIWDSVYSENCPKCELSSVYAKCSSIIFVLYLTGHNLFLCSSLISIVKCCYSLSLSLS